MRDALHVAGGVTDAVDARLAQGGLIAVQGPTALDTRTGVMAGPGSMALVTGTASTGPMTVAIGPHVAVTSRGSANGPYLGPTLEASTTVNIAAAPASGSRIDVVYAKQQDSTSGIPSPDVTTAPLYGVLTGTSGTTPTKPDLSTVVGAVELGTVTVAAGATSTNGANVTIANTARQTVARGGIQPVRSTDTDAGVYLGQYRDHPTAGLQRWDGSAWQPLVSDTGWLSAAVNAPVGGTAKVRNKNGVVTVAYNGAYNGAYNQNFVLFNLPAGCRPLLSMNLLCQGSGGAGNFPIFVNTNGDVAVAQAVTLNGSQVHFTFLAA